MSDVQNPKTNRYVKDIRLYRAEQAERLGEFDQAMVLYKQFQITDVNTNEFVTKRVKRLSSAQGALALARKLEESKDYKAAHTLFQVISEIYDGEPPSFVKDELRRLRQMWSYPIGGTMIWLWEDYIRFAVLSQLEKAGAELQPRHRLTVLRWRLLWRIMLILLGLSILGALYQLYLQRGY